MCFLLTILHYVSSFSILVVKLLFILSNFESCNDPTFVLDTKKHMGGKLHQAVTSVSKFNLIAVINHDNGRPQL